MCVIVCYVYSCASSGAFHRVIIEAFYPLVPAARSNMVAQKIPDNQTSECNNLQCTAAFTTKTSTATFLMCTTGCTSKWTHDAHFVKHAYMAEDWQSHRRFLGILVSDTRGGMVYWHGLFAICGTPVSTLHRRIWRTSPPPCLAASPALKRWAYWQERWAVVLKYVPDPYLLPGLCPWLLRRPATSGL